MAKNKNNAPAKPALAPADALYQAVSLCRKAGALTMGFDAAVSYTHLEPAGALCGQQG